MSRTIHFIVDSYTGLFITTANIVLYKFLPPTMDVAVPLTKENAEGIYGTFEGAVIFETETGVKKGIKDRVRSLKKDLNWSEEDIKNSPWVGVARQCARDRQHLKDFGLKIVSVTISEPKA